MSVPVQNCDGNLLLLFFVFTGKEPRAIFLKGLHFPMMRSAKSVDWLSTLKCSGGRSVDKNSYGDHDNLEDEAFNSSL